MTPSRLEAFSDGVLAIIITIMVLTMEAPKDGVNFIDLLPLLSKFLFYLLSFIYVGIYWNNHHHLFKATQKVDGFVLWANLALLFFLSLIPFTTSWMGNFAFGDSHIDLSHPAALYGINLFLCSVSFMILGNRVAKIDANKELLSLALEDQKKEKLSLLIYLLGIVMSFVYTPLALACYAFVALLWLIPDKRIEKVYKD